MSTTSNYEQAGELKIGQVGIANLRIKTMDVAKLAAEMRERVLRAPKMFEHAAVILDFGSLSRCPNAEAAADLVKQLRDAGVLPVALAVGTSDIEALAREIDLPLLARFRAQYESSAARYDERPVAAKEPAAVSAAAPTAATETTGLLHVTPLRSGQQIYAQTRDLIVNAMVGNGAEAIADGSIHVYGALRGRALAGARGDTRARIFCREFNAELVAIAGQYRVMEIIPSELQGKPVQVWLENDKLQFAVMN
ncbi:MAG: Septum site-determining protein MinC [Alphaproteobacteria bacterium ADurb.BinA280]|nr:MAG: Septum site-determining protein MinC [Alphaproteobacteria bacterium ADurb.BinA280]